jgi:hypothetical protein
MTVPGPGTENSRHPRGEYGATFLGCGRPQRTSAFDPHKTPALQRWMLALPVAQFGRLRFREMPATSARPNVRAAHGRGSGTGDMYWNLPIKPICTAFCPGSTV